MMVVALEAGHRLGCLRAVDVQGFARLLMSMRLQVCIESRILYAIERMPTSTGYGGTTGGDGAEAGLRFRG